MQLIENSAILSALCRFLYAFTASWDGSAVGSAWNGFSRSVGSVFRSSRSASRVLKAGRVVRDWPDSMVCRILSSAANLIPVSLHRLYTRFGKSIEGSRILRAAFYCGEQSVALLSWLLLALLVIPQDYWDNLYSFLGLSAILLLFWLGGMRHRYQRLDLRRVGPYPVMFAAVVFIFFVFSASISLSLRHLVFHITCMLAVLLCVSSVRTGKELMRLAAFSAIGLLAAAVYGFYQKAMGIEVDKLLVDLSANIDTPGRVFSFFENPNSYAFVIVMLSPMSLALTFYAKKWLRLLGLLSFLASMLALLATYSRGGWVSVAVAVLVFVLILRPSLVPLIIILGILCLPVLPASITNRIVTIFSGNDTSITSRSLLYDAAWKLIKFSPIRGAGLGSEVVKEAVENRSFYTNQMVFVHTHNIYLEIWCETGIFGLFAFLASILTSIRSGLNVIIGRKGEMFVRAAAAAGISGIVGILVYGIVDYPWSYPRVMLIFWFLFALLLCAVRIANREGES